MVIGQFSPNIQYDQSIMQMNPYIMYDQNMFMIMQYMSMMGYQQGIDSNLI
jgi:hypothetical protein